MIVAGFCLSDIPKDETLPLSDVSCFLWHILSIAHTKTSPMNFSLSYLELQKVEQQKGGADCFYLFPPSLHKGGPG